LKAKTTAHNGDRLEQVLATVMDLICEFTVIKEVLAFIAVTFLKLLLIIPLFAVNLPQPYQRRFSDHTPPTI
jgi:hypothetical protein